MARTRNDKKAPANTHPPSSTMLTAQPAPTRPVTHPTMMQPRVKARSIRLSLMISVQPRSLNTRMASPPAVRKSFPYSATWTNAQWLKYSIMRSTQRTRHEAHASKNWGHTPRETTVSNGADTTSYNHPTYSTASTAATGTAASTVNHDAHGLEHSHDEGAQANGPEGRCHRTLHGPHHGLLGVGHKPPRANGASCCAVHDVLDHEQAPEERNEHEELADVTVIGRVGLHTEEGHGPEHHPQDLNNQRTEGGVHHLRVVRHGSTRGREVGRRKRDAPTNCVHVAARTR